MRLILLGFFLAVALPSLGLLDADDLNVTFVPYHPKHLKPVVYEIVALDLEHNALSLKAGDKVITLHVRPGTDIKINGEKAGFDELATRMKVKVTLAEPGVAESLEANGSPAAPLNPTVASVPLQISSRTGRNGKSSLADILAGTKWNWPDENKPPKISWFILNPDMTAQAGWHHEHRTWKVLDDSRIELNVTVQQGVPKFLTFNKDFTQATDQNNLIYRRIN